VNYKNNLNIEKNNDVLVLNIKSIIKVFINRKWWFVITFIIVLILSILFSFSLYKNSYYGVKSQITIPLNNNNYQVMISKLYPEESGTLWLNLAEENIPSYLSYIVSSINNEIFVNELNKSLNFNLSNNKLWKRIGYNINDKKNKLTITTYSDNIETAKKINEALTSMYTNNMVGYFNATYDVLLSKVEKKITESEDQLNKNIEEYNTLVSIQKDLVENKDIYINRINVVNLPDVEQNFFLREVLIGIIVSVFAGMIVLFFVNFIYVKRKNKVL
jgi:hypothetical protein